MPLDAPNPIRGVWGAVWGVWWRGMPVLQPLIYKAGDGSPGAEAPVLREAHTHDGVEGRLGSDRSMSEPNSAALFPWLKAAH